MPVPAPNGPEADWSSVVRTREDADLAREIQERIARSPGFRPVSVTDLLALRRAYWRLAAPPVPVPADRRERMEAGRAWHRRIGAVLAGTGALEVRIRRGGLVGRIDALTDRPIEVKTSSMAVGPDHLIEERPEYLEQLGMYCALVESVQGRIVSLAVHDDRVDDVRTVEVAFQDPAGILEQMHHRAALLRASWESRRSEGLPRCPFFDRGCEFRSSGTCDCTGQEAEPPSKILEGIDELRSVPEEDRRLRAEFGGPVAPASGPSVARFRDMIYPRRAYFERTSPLPTTGGEWVSPLDTPMDAYGRIVDAMETGPVGEVARRPSLTTTPEEEVAVFRGDPFLVRSSRARSPPRAEELSERYPQYALELGFRCAATGRTLGRVFMTFERVGPGPDELRVFELRFASVTPFSRLWRARLGAFARALATGDPRALTPCPGWMVETCAYRDRCACGDEAGRSQR